MKLEVLRISSQIDSTSGVLFDVTDGKREFLCYTIEDEYRAQKVKHETRIPEGIYDLTLRSVGGFHSRYFKLNMVLIGIVGMIYVNECAWFRVYFMAHRKYR